MGRLEEEGLPALREEPLPEKPKQKRPYYAPPLPGPEEEASWSTLRKEAQRRRASIGGEMS